MKNILVLTLILIASHRPVSSQTICKKINIVSPIVSKPTDGVVISVSCSTLVIAWKGLDRYTASYVLTGISTDRFTNKKIVLDSAKTFCDNAGDCSATLKVLANTEVNWKVQAHEGYLSGDANYYSYPLRSTHPVVIPFCNSNKDVKSLTGKTESKSVAVEEETQGNIYPNPVQSILKITYNSTSTKDQLRVLDVYGRTIISQKATPGIMQLNVNRLSKGLYIIHIENSAGKILYTSKFIKG